MLFVAIIIGGTMLSWISYSALFMIITACCVYEFATLVNKTEGVHVNKLIVTLGGIYLFLAFMGFCMGVFDFSLLVPYIALLMYLLISELYLKREKPIHNWAYSMLSQMYVALPLALLNVLAFNVNSDEGGIITYNYILPLSVFVFIWLNDSGAYCAGMLFGKHRLFERISPKKSWEGSIGGAVVAVATSVVLWHFFPILSLPVWIGLALVVVVFGTWGDLCESLLKRSLGIKDSGNFLPGHGGFLDRFDSTLMAVPAAVVYLSAVQTW